ncbi:LETM1 domain-containing protein 1 isoform X1 [Parus major]|uniref:LETM1 domain-containing protein 1 isoform X1 n=1 Tax=Parus major TaxID=9157 RepID=UPI0007712B4B|nr:LETM1 domain-containing protein 1 isoform X1 [Parus major]
MALSRVAARGGLWRLGPAALSPPRGRMQLQLALGVSRSQGRSLSSRAASRALVAAVAAAARRVSARYERFLERSFPRFYLLYSTFKTGIQALFLEAKEIRRIKSKMSQQRLSSQQLPYREMERLRQVFLPTAAPDPLLLDAQAAAGVPGRVRPHPQGLVPGRAAEPGAGSALPARAPAPPAPAAALCPGAGRCSATPGPALGRQEFVLWVSAGAEQAPGGSCESPEPGAVPHPTFTGLFPAAPAAEPRPGDPTPGPCPAAAGAGAALRGGAASGLLPAGAELHSPGPGRVPGVAGAVAQALL